MRSIQWYILSIFSTLMGWSFTKLDYPSCSPSFEPLNSMKLVMCLNAEILDPFIMILFPLGIVLLVCGLIENRYENKKK
mgnify:CR=1 FL=1|jgi:hypothetical protein